MKSVVINEIFQFVKSHRKQIINFFTFIILCLIIAYLANNRAVFAKLKDINPKHILIISVMCLGSVFVNSMINYYLLTIFNIIMPIGESFLLQYASSLLNNITPRGGILFRGMYMKSIYDFNYSNFIIVVAGFYVINFSANALWGLISAFFIYLNSGKYNLGIILFLLCILIVMAFLTFFSPNLESKKGKLFEYLNKIIQGWNLLKQNKKIVLLIVLSLLMITLATIQQHYVYSSLGENGTFWEILFLTSVGNLSILVNLTPSGIGIKEAVLVFSADIITITPEVIVLGSMLTRIVAFITSALFGGISYLVLTKKLRKSS